MFDVYTVDDATLATCVDEYCKRIVAVIRSDEAVKAENVNVSIQLNQYNREAEYTITHTVSVGDSYGSKPNFQKYSGSNAILGACDVLRRYHQDAETPPTRVVPLLEVDKTDIEDAEFIPVPPPSTPYSESLEVEGDALDTGESDDRSH